MKTFGKRDYNLEYKKRTGSYAIIKNTEDKFLVVEDEEGNFYLIGGGVENGETPPETLARESIEETGYQVKIERFLGQAEKYWVSKKYPQWSQHNIGFFYMCTLLEKISEPIEKERMSWVSFTDLEKHLFHEHHLYMVKKSLDFWD